MILTHKDGTVQTVRAGTALNGVAITAVIIQAHDLKDFFYHGERLGRSFADYLINDVFTRLVP